jgi:hypothetical protein
LPPIYAEFLRTILHVVDFVHATSLIFPEYDTEPEPDMDSSEDEDSTDSGFHPEGEEEDDEP